MPFLQLGYKRIHYTDLKPEQNAIRETFIFMHGLGSSQDFYHAIAVVLQSHNFRCILFDTTGAGRSPYTQVEQSIESLSSDVIGILDALEAPKAIVVGHSMGGIVAAHLAAQHNDRIAAAILIGPVYPSPQVIPIFETRIAAIEKQGMEAVANTVPLSATGQKASPIARSFIRELLLGQDAAGYISLCRVIIDAKPPQYSAVKVPVLILAGDEDKSAPLEGCRKMFEELGTTEKKLEVMEGIGHWHCLEDFEGVGERILGFYREIQ